MVTQPDAGTEPLVQESIASLVGRTIMALVWLILTVAVLFFGLMDPGLFLIGFIMSITEVAFVVDLVQSVKTYAKSSTLSEHKT